MEDMKTGNRSYINQQHGNKAHKLPQYLASFTVSLGAFGQGTVAGWTSPVELPLLTGALHYTVSEYQLAWIGALMALGAAAIVIPMGFIIDAIGRKNAMLLLVIPFTLGWALMIWSTLTEMLYAGRFLTGMAGGAFAISGPIYTTEIAQKEIRGLMGSFYQNLVVIGILFTYSMGSVLSPFWLSVVCAAVPILFGVTFIFMPETPVYFLKINEPKKARESLRWLRGPDYDIEPEICELNQAVEEEKKDKATLRELFSTRGTVKGLVVSVGLLCLQQLSGINYATFYTTIIFQEAGSFISPSHATIIVGSCQVLFTLLSGLVVDRTGRKVLLIASHAMMGLCMLVLGTFFYLKNAGTDVSSYGWLSIVSITVYFVAFALGSGPLPWIIMAEVFLPGAKAAGSAVTCLVNWLLAFVVTKFFVDMTHAFGMHSTLWVFALVSLSGIAFVHLVVPETKGKSTEQIFLELNGGSDTDPGHSGGILECELRGRGRSILHI